MSVQVTIVAALLAAAFSYAITVLVEKRAVALGLIKGPNERSSHIVPTARGGGLGLALVGVIGCGAFSLAGAPLLAIVGALGAVIAIVGFFDDLRDVSVSVRLAAQTAVVVALVVSADLLLRDPALGAVSMLEILVLGVTVLVGIWWVNVFNFMDGIDGIAASQATLILLGASIIWLLADAQALADPTFGVIMIIVAGAGGFLLRNWPPAKIFMGDVGSTFLGFVIFTTLLITVVQGSLTLVTWVILLCVFATDSTITILRRTLRGERPWRAHRRHAYQQLSRRWGHRSVTLLYAGLTALWAFPLAAASEAVPSIALWLVPTAYLPLGILFLWAGAGAREEL